MVVWPSRVLRRYLKNLSGQRFGLSAITDVLVNSAHSLISQIGVFLNAHKVLTSDSAGTSGMCTQQWSTTWFSGCTSSKSRATAGNCGGRGLRWRSSRSSIWKTRSSQRWCLRGWRCLEFWFVSLRSVRCFCRGCKPNWALVLKTQAPWIDSIDQMCEQREPNPRRIRLERPAL